MRRAALLILAVAASAPPYAAPPFVAPLHAAPLDRDEVDRRLAELPRDRKAQLSHRGRALQQLRARWVETGL